MVGNPGRSIESSRHGASVTCHEETESNGLLGGGRGMWKFCSLTRSLIRSLARLASLCRCLFVRRRHPPCAWRFLSRTSSTRRVVRQRAPIAKINPQYISAVFWSFARGRLLLGAIPEASVRRLKRNKYARVLIFRCSLHISINLQIIRKPTVAHTALTLIYPIYLPSQLCRLSCYYELTNIVLNLLLYRPLLTTRWTVIPTSVHLISLLYVVFRKYKPPAFSRIYRRN